MKKSNPSPSSIVLASRESEDKKIQRSLNRVIRDLVNSDFAPHRNLHFNPAIPNRRAVE